MRESTLLAVIVPVVVMVAAGVPVPGAKLSVRLTVAPVDAALTVTAEAESVKVTLPVVLNCKVGVEIARVPMAPEPLVRVMGPEVAVTVDEPVIVPEVVPVRVTVVP